MARLTFCAIHLLSIGFIAQAVSAPQEHPVYQHHRALPHIQGTVLAEDIQVTFANGIYKQEKNAVTLVQGIYEVRGNYLIIEDKWGKAACSDKYRQIAFSIYTWDIDANNDVYVTPLEDECNDRRRTFYLANPFKMMPKQ